MARHTVFQVNAAPLADGTIQVVSEEGQFAYVTRQTKNAGCLALRPKTFFCADVGQGIIEGRPATVVIEVRPPGPSLQARQAVKVFLDELAPLVSFQPCLDNDALSRSSFRLLWSSTEPADIVYANVRPDQRDDVEALVGELRAQARRFLPAFPDGVGASPNDSMAGLKALLVPHLRDDFKWLERIAADATQVIAARTERFDDDPLGFTREWWQEGGELVRDTCVRAAHEANAHLRQGGANVTLHFVESDLEWNGAPCKFLLLTHEQARLAERLGVAQRLTSAPPHPG